MLVLVDLAPDSIEVDLGNDLGLRAGARNRTVVDRVHAADFSSGATHEDFFGDVQIAAGEVVDTNVVPLIASDGHHAVLSDALKRASRQRRGDDDVITHRKDVLAGALGNKAIGRQHDGFVVTGLEGLDLGQRRVHVVANGLGGRRHRVVIVTGP